MISSIWKYCTSDSTLQFKWNWGKTHVYVPVLFNPGKDLKNSEWYILAMRYNLYRIKLLNNPIHLMYRIVTWTWIHLNTLVAVHKQDRYANRKMDQSFRLIPVCSKTGLSLAERMMLIFVSPFLNLISQLTNFCLRYPISRWILWHWQRNFCLDRFQTI